MRWILASVVALGLGVLASPGEVECGWCPTLTCFSSSACGQGCVCISQPGEVAGRCYGVGFSSE